MGLLQSLVLAFFSVLLASFNARLLSAQSTGSLVSLDCGLSQGQSYIDQNGIKWLSDAPYIAIGETAVVFYTSGNNPLNSLRYFKEDRSKYCYLIPDLVQGNYYLVRPNFYYGNYDNLNIDTISFSFIIDTQYWNITITGASTSWWWEEYYVPAKSTSMSICLARDTKEKFTPFISSLEIRPLPDTLPSVKVLNNQYASTTIYRMDYGASANSFKRYPTDTLDRFWFSKYDSTTLNTTYLVSTGESLVPSIVLQTSLSQLSSLTLNLTNTVHSNYFLAFFFAEINPNVLKVGDRVFDIYLDTNSELFSSNIDIFGEVGKYREYTIASTKPIKLTKTPKFTFKENIASSYYPILAGMELMGITENLLEPGTFEADVLALEDVKKSLNLETWMGDPCLPFTFDWLNCTSGIQTQIRALLLSNQNLQGLLSPSLNSLIALEIIELNGNMLTGNIPDLSHLKALRTLDLSNNSLEGPIPVWLSTLPNLQYLSLQNNNFTGSIPKQLLEKQDAGTLSFNYDNITVKNEEMAKETAQKKTSSSLIIIGVVIGAATLVAIIVGAILCIRMQCCKINFNSGKKSKFATDVISEDKDTKTQDGMEIPMTNYSISSTSSPNFVPGMKLKKNSTRELSYHEIEIATDNFKKVLGHGGSGPVYFGILPNGDVVAVKKFLNDFGYGSDMFTTEVEILSMVHHANLVPMIGYCLERELMLVYRCMQKGTLRDFLYGKSSKTPLSWKTRLLIALGAAEGLDYLHTKCQPRIIHRDVKTDNILLDDNLRAKVSDFGISRSRPDEDVTHVQTKAMGTQGYADPEMVLTGKLTTKSDVYSFGVVLLEILCGRAPIDPSRSKEEAQIIKAVRLHVRNNDLLAVVDSSLTNGQNCKYNITSMWIVANIALSSTRKSGKDRPSMKDVVANLNEALKHEFGDENPLFEDPSTYN